jgi:hypothetical protein
VETTATTAAEANGRAGTTGNNNVFVEQPSTSAAANPDPATVAVTKQNNKKNESPQLTRVGSGRNQQPNTTPQQHTKSVGQMLLKVIFD